MKPDPMLVPATTVGLLRDIIKALVGNLADVVQDARSDDPMMPGQVTVSTFLTRGGAVTPKMLRFLNYISRRLGAASWDEYYLSLHQRSEILAGRAKRTAPWVAVSLPNNVLDVLTHADRPYWQPFREGFRARVDVRRRILVDAFVQTRAADRGFVTDTLSTMNAFAKLSSTNDLDEEAWLFLCFLAMLLPTACPAREKDTAPAVVAAVTDVIKAWPPVASWVLQSLPQHHQAEGCAVPHRDLETWANVLLGGQPSQRRELWAFEAVVLSQLLGYRISQEANDVQATSELAVRLARAVPFPRTKRGGAQGAARAWHRVQLAMRTPAAGAFRYAEDCAYASANDPASRKARALWFHTLGRVLGDAPPRHAVTVHQAFASIIAEATRSDRMAIRRILKMWISYMTA